MEKFRDRDEELVERRSRKFLWEKRNLLLECRTFNVESGLAAEESRISTGESRRFMPKSRTRKDISGLP